MGSRHFQKALVVGISGCSSSGKTTLARMLRDIFPASFILHEDDFYRPEDQLPTKDGLLDWDCAEALDIPSLTKSLSYIQQNGTLPPTLDSKEDSNSVGSCPVSAEHIATLTNHVRTRLSSLPRICFLDGFLLYSPPLQPIQPHLDIKLFLRTSYARAKARREARDGYVTLEGFWKDPPDYVDKIVWPNYVKEHGWLFRRGDVEGKYDEEALDTHRIQVVDRHLGRVQDLDMTEVLDWSVKVILAELEGKA